MPRQRKPTILDQLFSEVVLFGGLPLTRASVVRIMQEDGFERRAIDLFAFAKPSVDLAALSYDEFRAIEAA